MLWHWSTDVEKFKRENPQGYRLWRLKHLINYGLEKDEKISKRELIKNWEKIKDDLDPYARREDGVFIMGRTILTPRQLKFLELAQAQPSLTKRFYLTGGSALSEFYFQH